MLKKHISHTLRSSPCKPTEIWSWGFFWYSKPFPCQSSVALFYGCFLPLNCFISVCLQKVVISFLAMAFISWDAFTRLFLSNVLGAKIQRSACRSKLHEVALQECDFPRCFRFALRETRAGTPATNVVHPGYSNSLCQKKRIPIRLLSKGPQGKLAATRDNFLSKPNAAVMSSKTHPKES